MTHLTPSINASHFDQPEPHNKIECTTEPQLRVQACLPHSDENTLGPVAQLERLKKLLLENPFFGEHGEQRTKVLQHPTYIPWKAVTNFRLDMVFADITNFHVNDDSRTRDYAQHQQQGRIYNTHTCLLITITILASFIGIDRLNSLILNITESDDEEIDYNHNRNHSHSYAKVSNFDNNTRGPQNSPIAQLSVMDTPRSPPATIGQKRHSRKRHDRAYDHESKRARATGQQPHLRYKVEADQTATDGTRDKKKERDQMAAEQLADVPVEYFCMTVPALYSCDISSMRTDTIANHLARMADYCGKILRSPCPDVAEIQQVISSIVSYAIQLADSGDTHSLRLPLLRSIDVVRELHDLNLLCTLHDLLFKIHYNQTSMDMAKRHVLCQHDYASSPGAPPHHLLSATLNMVAIILAHLEHAPAPIFRLSVSTTTPQTITTPTTPWTTQRPSGLTRIGVSGVSAFPGMDVRDAAPVAVEQLAVCLQESSKPMLDADFSMDAEIATSLAVEEQQQVVEAQFLEQAADPGDDHYQKVQETPLLPPIEVKKETAVADDETDVAMCSVLVEKCLRDEEWAYYEAQRVFPVAASLGEVHMQAQVELFSGQFWERQSKHADLTAEERVAILGKASAAYQRAKKLAVDHNLSRVIVSACNAMAQLEKQDRSTSILMLSISLEEVGIVRRSLATESLMIAQQEKSTPMARQLLTLLLDEATDPVLSPNEQALALERALEVANLSRGRVLSDSRHCEPVQAKYWMAQAEELGCYFIVYSSLPEQDQLAIFVIDAKGQLHMVRVKVEHESMMTKVANARAELTFPLTNTKEAASAPCPHAALDELSRLLIGNIRHLLPHSRSHPVGCKLELATSFTDDTVPVLVIMGDAELQLLPFAVLRDVYSTTAKPNDAQDDTCPFMVDNFAVSTASSADMFFDNQRRAQVDSYVRARPSCEVGVQECCRIAEQTASTIARRASDAAHAAHAKALVVEAEALAKAQDELTSPTSNAMREDSLDVFSKTRCGDHEVPNFDAAPASLKPDEQKRQIPVIELPMTPPNWEMLEEHVAPQVHVAPQAAQPKVHESMTPPMTSTPMDKPNADGYSSVMVGVSTFPEAKRGHLRYVKQEVGTIARLHDAIPMLESECTPKKVLSRLLNVRNRVAHIGTHAYLEATTSVHGTYDTKGALLLSADDVPIAEGYHGWELPARVIGDANLAHLDFVVLSACHTAEGHILHHLSARVPMEGPVGLARAFAKAGAKSVVSSLWAVNDLATTFIQIHLHSNLKKARKIPEKTPGACKPRALREAMLSLRSEGRAFQHPYFWGAFVVSGDLL